MSNQSAYRKWFNAGFVSKTVSYKNSVSKGVYVTRQSLLPKAAAVAAAKIGPSDGLHKAAGASLGAIARPLTGNHKASGVLAYARRLMTFRRGQ